MGTDHLVHDDHDADRLDLALQHLVESDRLSRSQADAVRTEFESVAAPPVRSPWTSVLPEVGGYVGGAFLLAAAVVLAAPRWDELSRIAQVAILGVPAVLLLGAALAIAWSTPGGWSVHARSGLGARRRLVSVILVVGGAAAVGAAAVIAGPGSGDRIAATTAAVLAVAGYLLCRTPLLHVAALAALVVTVNVWWAWAIPTVIGPWRGEEQGPVIVSSPDVAIGVTLAGLAVGWAVLALVGVLDERHLGLVAAGAVYFLGAENLAGATDRPGINGLGYVLLASLAVAGLVGYVKTRYVGVLAVGVAALATVVPQAVIDYTNGALGAAGALLLVGLSIVGASLVGVRLRTAAHPQDEPSGVDVTGRNG